MAFASSVSVCVLPCLAWALRATVQLQVSASRALNVEVLWCLIRPLAFNRHIALKAMMPLFTAAAPARWPQGQR